MADDEQRDEYTVQLDGLVLARRTFRIPTPDLAALPLGTGVYTTPDGERIPFVWGGS